MPTALYYLHDPFAPSPNKPTRFGAAVVIMADGKILLEHRKDNFRWGIVSGDIHLTETFKDCAIRKTIEETGIHLAHAQLKEIKLFDDPSRIVSFLEGNIYRIVQMAYAVDLFTEPETICGEESIELKWVPVEEISQYQLVVTNQDILEAFFQMKGIDCTAEREIWRR